jgi:hypothetical protein
VTDERPWLVISSDNDAIFASLDRLHAKEAERKAIWLAKLAHSVASLGLGSTPEPEESMAPRSGGGFGDRPGMRPDPEPATPFVPMPERTTHGGPFGAVAREAIIAAALAKDGW